MDEIFQAAFRKENVVPGVAKVCEMTWLGRVEAEYRGELSSYEGLGHNFAIDGNLNLEAITQHLIRSAGVSERFCDNLKPPMFLWQDNHTALILNLMRFAHLLRAYEQQRGPKSLVELKSYNDGVISINPADTFNDWGPEYSNEWKIHWPGGTDAANYPDIVQHYQQQDCLTDRDAEVIDLRLCSKEDILIILMMTGAWKRTSLYKSDFSLPKLADKIRYRTLGICPFLTNWQTGGARRPSHKAPKVPKSSAVWRALVVYVETNRVFTSFSLALYLFTTTACAMVPNTAEQQIWQGLTTRLVVPRFHSIRGRCFIFNQARCSMVNHRARQEWYCFAKIDKWSVLNPDLRKLQSLTIAVTQAIYIGLGVRAMRRGIGTHQDELDATEESFLIKEKFFPAAIAQVLDMPAPILSGMEGVYAYFEGFTEHELAEPIALVATIKDDEKAHKLYDIVANDRGEKFLLVRRYSLPGTPTLLFPGLRNVPGYKFFSEQGDTVSGDLKKELDGIQVELSKNRISGS